MNKEMIISTNGHETRVAILEDDLLAEVFVERERNRGVVGNVYKGRVSKVLRVFLSAGARPPSRPRLQKKRSVSCTPRSSIWPSLTIFGHESSSPGSAHEARCD